MARKKKDAPKSLGEQLEAALVANPYDLATHGAYADWLLEQGDPRGEFIGVQMDLEQEGRPARERKKLQKREAELLEKHGRQWLGDLAPFLLDHEGMSVMSSAPQFRFARGWLDQLDIDSLSVNIARLLVRSPQTQLLRELSVNYPTSVSDQPPFEPGDDVPTWERDHVQFVSLHPLVRSPFLSNVRVFRLGEEQGDEYRAFNSSPLGIAAVDLIQKMPRLEELSLLSHEVDTARLFGLKSLKSLRVLRVYHMNHYPLEILARNAASSNLTHLLLHPHCEQGFDRPPTWRSGPYIRLPQVRAIVRSPHLKSLTHLRLRVSDMGDAGCREIVASGILRRLKTLDLRHGCITDEGARILAECPDLKQLEFLDLDRNALTAQGIAALRQVGISLRIDEQQSDTEFAAGQYLREGDFE